MRLLPVVLLFVLALSAEASAAWRGAVTLDSAAVRSASVAVDDQGRAAAAWIRGDTVRARVGGRVVDVQSSGGRLEGATIGVGPRNAIVAWTRRGRVEARRVSYGGGVSLRQRLSGDGPAAFGPDWVGGTLAWLRGTDEPDLQLAVPRRDGRFEGTIRYDIDGLLDVDLAPSRAGGLVAAFTRERGSDVDIVVAEQAAGRARLRDVFTPETAGLPRDPAVAVSATGRTVVAWTEGDREAGGERIMVAARPRGGSFGAPAPLATGVYATQLALVPKADGSVLAAWIASQRFAETSPGILRVADVNDGVVRNVSAAGEEVERWAGAVDGRGIAHFAWWSDSASEPGGPVFTRVVDAQERLQTRYRLTPLGERATSLSLAAGARGEAAALWTRAGGGLRMALR